MAKTKTKGTNAKIKELKGIKPEKVTDDQLEKLQTTVNNINRLKLDIGSVEIQKYEIMTNLSSLRDTISSLQAEFQKDYDTYDVNIQDGTINYPKENGEVNKED